VQVFEPSISIWEVGDAMASLRWVILLLLLAVVSLGRANAGKPINVTYDQRALVIDGQRRMLISAGIHYPRATPEVTMPIPRFLFQDVAEHEYVI